MIIETHSKNTAFQVTGLQAYCSFAFQRYVKWINGKWKEYYEAN